MIKATRSYCFGSFAETIMIIGNIIGYFTYVSISTITVILLISTKHFNTNQINLLLIKGATKITDIFYLIKYDHRYL